MLKLPIAYVDIRFSVHATEDAEKVGKAVSPKGGSGRRSGTSTEVFFRYNLVTAAYSETITASPQWFSQMALGPDGTIYGGPSGETNDSAE